MTRTLAALFVVALPLTAVADTNLAPFGKGQSLAERTLLEKTTVCVDDKGHYVGLMPSEKQAFQIFYGDGKKLTLVPLPAWVLPGDTFFDPRFFNKTANENFRGVDYRVHSSVKVDTAKNTCALQCGDRNIPLKIVPAEKTTAMLTSATYGKVTARRVPHALFRDTLGNYYLVDRGGVEGTEKNFRIYIGHKGALKKREMTDVINDSEGQLFATKNGRLRMAVDTTGTGEWLEPGKKPLTLKRIPVEDNWQMIYNELGVYDGEKFGTPCDDF
jgi:hypothetical protein